MTKTLKERAELTTTKVLDILGLPETDHPKEVTDALKQAIIGALIEERVRCADVAYECCREDTEKAKVVAEEIRQVQSVLVTNLSAMR